MAAVHDVKDVQYLNNLLKRKSNKLSELGENDKPTVKPRVKRKKKKSKSVNKIQLPVEAAKPQEVVRRDVSGVRDTQRQIAPVVANAKQGNAQNIWARLNKNVVGGVNNIGEGGSNLIDNKIKPHLERSNNGNNFNDDNDALKRAENNVVRPQEGVRGIDSVVVKPVPRQQQDSVPVLPGNVVRTSDQNRHKPVDVVGVPGGGENMLQNPVHRPDMPAIVPLNAGSLAKNMDKYNLNLPDQKPIRLRDEFRNVAHDDVENVKTDDNVVKPQENGIHSDDNVVRADDNQVVNNDKLRGDIPANQHDNNYQDNNINRNWQPAVNQNDLPQQQGNGGKTKKQESQRIMWDWSDFLINYEQYVMPEQKVRRAPHATTGEPWPLPQYYITSNTKLFRLDREKFHFRVSKETCDIIEKAVDRYKDYILYDSVQDMYDNLQHAQGSSLEDVYEKYGDEVHSQAQYIDELNIKIRQPCARLPHDKMDESCKWVFLYSCFLV